MSKGVGGRAQTGQATIELAFALPVVVVVIAAVVEIGLTAGDQLRLWHAAREAARAAVVDPEPDAAREVVTNQGFERATVSVTPSSAERRQGDPLTVTLDYRRPSQVPVVGRIFDGLQLRAQATMRIEQP